MAKKKSKKNSDAEMIHFRPGSELGSLLTQFAEQFTISRGEAAKRLVSLAIRGLDVGLHGQAAQLTQYLYGTATFDEAVHHLHVAIRDRTNDPDVEVVDTSREDKVQIANELVERYRVLREFEEQAQQQRVSIKLYRTNQD